MSSLPIWQLLTEGLSSVKLPATIDFCLAALIFFAYGGYNASANLAEEVRICTVFYTFQILLSRSMKKTMPAFASFVAHSRQAILS